MAKWIYAIEDSFETDPKGIVSDLAAVLALVAALGAGLTWLMF